jgi:anti-sigma-K factor RskA
VGAEPVNPQWHDEFVALCALFPSGELSGEEWALLQVHLAYCDSCRAVFRHYEHLADNVMPVVAAIAYSDAEFKPETSSFSLDEVEQRLMSELNSRPTDQESHHRRKTKWQIPAGILAACALAVAGLMGLHFAHSKKELKSEKAAPVTVERTPRPALPTNEGADLRPELERAREDVAKLQQQLSAAEERDRQSSSSAAILEHQLEADQSERKMISDARDRLSQQLAAEQIEAQSLRANSAVAGGLVDQQTTQTTALEAKVHELSAALDEKDRTLALDKDFLDHDREIRDLIAARNLYIADIFDVAQNGKTAKPFGRVFYTKDKSLVFYGYDLDKQAGLKQSVAFQAWGSGDDKQNVSLGLFYQDGTQRWVLRFNDTKTLARLNKVFVTAEPQGGSTEPTGKQILMAYLQVQPNHP